MGEDTGADTEDDAKSEHSDGSTVSRVSGATNDDGFELIDDALSMADEDEPWATNGAPANSEGSASPTLEENTGILSRFFGWGGK